MLARKCVRKEEGRETKQREREKKKERILAIIYPMHQTRSRTHRKMPTQQAMLSGSLISDHRFLCLASFEQRRRQGQRLQLESGQVPLAMNCHTLNGELLTQPCME